MTHHKKPTFHYRQESLIDIEKIVLAAWIGHSEHKLNWEEAGIMLYLAGLLLTSTAPKPKRSRAKRRSRSLK